MSLSYDFSGQTALVTGAATGMGRAAALLYAEAGASVALLDVNVDEVSALAEELKAGGGDALALQCDVRDEAQVAEAVQQTVARWGKLDMAYNNAQRHMIGLWISICAVSGPQPSMRLYRCANRGMARL